MSAQAGVVEKGFLKETETVKRKESFNHLGKDVMVRGDTLANGK